MIPIQEIEQKKTKPWFEKKIVQIKEYVPNENFDQFVNVELPIKDFWFKGRIKYKSELKEFLAKGHPGKLFTLVMFNNEGEI